ncbi:MAG: hypothetical protein NW223_00650 [Hyphomicrobiaceae bacterium]|nr:hypothetical protein [Hyphomicrobiaceae bacterium]
MPRPDIHEFTVDVQARTVTHPCGASWSYYRYPDGDDWEKAGGLVTNPQLIPGDEIEYTVMAKLAAKRQGMQNA